MFIGQPRVIVGCHVPKKFLITLANPDMATGNDRIFLRRQRGEITIRPCGNGRTHILRIGG
jgi:hypothetical protein